MMMKAVKLDLAGPGAGQKSGRSGPGAKQEKGSSKSRGGAGQDKGRSSAKHSRTKLDRKRAGARH